ncbi:MAG: three-Cys-motif partner protein TcmP [Chloroflexi bacterium]|nr:three-Cys-motif partner protein TcmP [Chloroflexota bacterium]
MTKVPSDYRIDPADGLPARVVREWARRKHHYLERYTGIFASGMKKKFPQRAYLDLFAGPGRCFERETGEIYDGSPLIGLHRNFTDHIYVELEDKAAAALETRCSPYTPGRRVTVIQGDCNAKIDEVIAHLPRSGITFAFIDPTNWQISFDTIQKLTAARRVDLLVSFFGPSMKRVADLDRPRLDAFFGTKAWQTDPRFLGPDRLPTLSGLLACYREQLARIGYLNQVSAREIPVKNSKNVPMYLLAFFSKHPLGYTFWDRITTEDEKGQIALTW